MFCTAQHLLHIALQLQRWRWFSPVGSPKRGNEGPFCTPNPLNNDFDNSTGLKGVCLKARPSPFAHNPHLKTKLSLCCPFGGETKTVTTPLLMVFFTRYGRTKTISKDEKNLDSRRFKFLEMNDVKFRIKSHREVWEKVKIKLSISLHFFKIG